VSIGTRRKAGIPSFGSDRVAPIVSQDPAVLRLESLDPDPRPAEAALRATQTAACEANSWLPFTGKLDLKRSMVDKLMEQSGIRYNPEIQTVITCGDGDVMVDAPL